MADLLDLPKADRDRFATELGRANFWRSEDRLHLTLEALEADDAEPASDRGLLVFQYLVAAVAVVAAALLALVN